MLPPIPSPTARDCPKCGAMVDDAKIMHCPHCGAALSNGTRLTSRQILWTVFFAATALMSAGVGACSISVINSKGELPELGWIGFWPAFIVLVLCLWGIIHVTRKK